MCCMMGAEERAGGARGERTESAVGILYYVWVSAFYDFLHKFNNSQYQFQWNLNVSRSIGSRMWISVSDDDSRAGWLWRGLRRVRSIFSFQSNGGTLIGQPFSNIPKMRILLSIAPVSPHVHVQDTSTYDCIQRHYSELNI